VFRRPGSVSVSGRDSLSAGDSEQNGRGAEKVSPPATAAFWNSGCRAVVLPP